MLKHIYLKSRKSLLLLKPPAHPPQYTAAKQYFTKEIHIKRNPKIHTSQMNFVPSLSLSGYSEMLALHWQSK